MRQSEIQFIEAATRYAARKAAPWAAVLAKMNGGYLAFATFRSYRLWKGYERC
jgi:hypothetical protein